MAGIVVVGTSLGGFHALNTVLGALPKEFPLPIAVVQHRSFDDPDLLAPLLSTYVQMPVIEIEDKEPIKASRIFIGPANYHVLIDNDHFALSTDAPVLYARPSIDTLFESAADAMGEGVIGVLLTGMSRDGTAGLKRIRERGGCGIVQDPNSAEGRVMPQAAIASAAADKILPLEEIAPVLMELSVGQKVKA
jgi:two-component system chemotaxis response regulator CheB